MLKEFSGKVRYIGRSIVMHKYTLYFEIARLGFLLCKESLVHKIAIVTLTPSLTLNGPIMAKRRQHGSSSMMIWAGIVNQTIVFGMHTYQNLEDFTFF